MKEFYDCLHRPLKIDDNVMVAFSNSNSARIYKGKVVGFTERTIKIEYEQISFPYQRAANTKGYYDYNNPKKRIRYANMSNERGIYKI